MNLMMAALIATGIAATSAGIIVHAREGSVSAESSQPALVRCGAQDGADAPSGRLLLRMPASDGQPAPQPAPEEGEPPSEPGDSAYDDEPGDLVYHGEALAPTFVWVLDYSGSMSNRDVASTEDQDGNLVSSPQRLQVVRIECMRVLRQLDDRYSFDIIKLAGNVNPDCPNISPPVTKSWRGALTPATPENVESAASYIQAESFQSGTPTWTALNKATHDYDFSDGGSLHVLTDGAPTNLDYPNAPGTKPWQSREAQRTVL
ncbi:MAG: hypothetical protein L6Q71_08345, partial [Planctomycetes bacterium]|nr:hypothetical protein [Planctomycetota bacterium]